MPLIIKRKTTKHPIKKRHLLFISNIVILIIMIYRAVYIAYHFGAIDLGHFYIEELNILQATPEDSMKNRPFFIEVSVNLSKCTCPLYLEFIDISGHLFQSEDKDITDPSVSILVSKIKFDKKKPFEFKARLEFKSNNLKVPLLDLISQEFRIEVRFITKARFCYIPLSFSKIIRRKKSQLITKGGESVDLSFLSTRIENLNGVSCLQLGIRKKFFTLINNGERFLFNVGCLKIFFEGFVDFFMIVTSFSTDIYSCNSSDNIIPGITINESEDPDESIVFYFVNIPFFNIEKFLEKMIKSQKKYLRVKMVAALLDEDSFTLEQMINEKNIPEFIESWTLNKLVILNFDQSNSTASDDTVTIGGWRYGDDSVSFGVGIEELYHKILEFSKTSSFLRAVVLQSYLEGVMSIKGEETVEMTVYFNETLRDDLQTGGLYTEELHTEGLYTDGLHSKEKLHHTEEKKLHTDELNKEEYNNSNNNNNSSNDRNVLEIKMRLLKRSNIHYKALSDITIDLNKIVICGISIATDDLFKVNINYPNQVSLENSRGNSIVLYKFTAQPNLHSIVLKHVLSDYPESNFFKVESEIDLDSYGFIDKKTEGERENINNVTINKSDVTINKSDVTINKNSLNINKGDYNLFKRNVNINSDYNQLSNKRIVNISPKMRILTPYCILSITNSFLKLRSTFFESPVEYFSSKSRMFSGKIKFDSVLAVQKNWNEEKSFGDAFKEEEISFSLSDGLFTVKFTIDELITTEDNSTIIDKTIITGCNSIIKEDTTIKIEDKTIKIEDKTIKIEEEPYVKVFPFKIKYDENILFSGITPSKLSISHFCENITDLKYYSLCRDQQFYKEHSLYNSFKSLDHSLLQNTAIPLPFYIKNVFYSEKAVFTRFLGGLPVIFKSEGISIVLTFTSKKMLVYFPKVTKVQIEVVSPEEIAEGVDRWITERCHLHRFIDFVLEAALRQPVTNKQQYEQQYINGQQTTVVNGQQTTVVNEQQTILVNEQQTTVANEQYKQQYIDEKELVVLKNRKREISFDVNLKTEKFTVFTLEVKITIPKICIPDSDVVRMELFGKYEIMSYDRKDFRGFYFFIDFNNDDENFTIYSCINMDTEYIKNEHDLQVKFNGEHVSFIKLNIEKFLEFFTGIFIKGKDMKIKEEVEFLGEKFKEAFSNSNVKGEDKNINNSNNVKGEYKNINNSNINKNNNNNSNISSIYKFDPILSLTDDALIEIPPLLDVQFDNIKGEKSKIDFHISIGLDNLILFLGDLLYRNLPVPITPESLSVNIQMTEPFFFKFGNSNKKFIGVNRKRPNFIGMKIISLKSKSSIKVPIRPFIYSNNKSEYSNDKSEYNNDETEYNNESNDKSEYNNEREYNKFKEYRNFMQKSEKSKKWMNLEFSIMTGDSFNIPIDITENQRDFKMSLNEPFESLMKYLLRNDKIITINHLNSNINSSNSNNNNSINSSDINNSSNSNNLINTSNTNNNTSNTTSNTNLINNDVEPFVRLRGVRYTLFLLDIKIPFFIRFVGEPLLLFTNSSRTVSLATGLNGLLTDLSVVEDGYFLSIPLQLFKSNDDVLRNNLKLHLSNFNHLLDVDSSEVSQEIFLLLKRELLCYKTRMLKRDNLGMCMKAILTGLGKWAICKLTMRNSLEFYGKANFFIFRYFYFLNKEDRNSLNKLFKGVPPDRKYLETIRKFLVNDETVIMLSKCLKMREKAIIQNQ